LQDNPQESDMEQIKFDQLGSPKDFNLPPVILEDQDTDGIILQDKSHGF